MKKQKFNGKLRLKKNVISGFNAAQVRGGMTANCPFTATDGFLTCGDLSECCDTLWGTPTCGGACNLTQDPGCVSGTPDCHTVHINTDCPCL
ncbi:hypothetical protein [Roseivirga echinicomitans]|uniref:hypothetical protein n=1 Tax=Roseivirga echinicomitans TaxID=296218 RepID=UPI0008397FE1|nr:hypothetical protein [Roseivirga echinicomitans]